LILAGFFALGMIPLDTLDSVLLRSAFARIFDSKGFRYMSYTLSGAAISVAAMATYENLTGAKIIPEITGPVLAGGIMAVSFAYSFGSRRRQRGTLVVKGGDPPSDSR